jgi:hypothetical protein
MVITILQVPRLILCQNASMLAHFSVGPLHCIKLSGINLCRILQGWTTMRLSHPIGIQHDASPNLSSNGPVVVVVVISAFLVLWTSKKNMTGTQSITGSIGSACSC